MRPLLGPLGLAIFLLVILVLCLISYALYDNFVVRAARSFSLAIFFFFFCYFPTQSSQMGLITTDVPFNVTLVLVYAPTSNAEEAEVEWFSEDLQDLLELTPEKDFLFIIGDWNAKVGSQEISIITGKYGLGVQNEARQRLAELSQEKALVLANTLFQ